MAGKEAGNEKETNENTGSWGDAFFGVHPGECFAGGTDMR